VTDQGCNPVCSPVPPGLIPSHTGASISQGAAEVYISVSTCGKDSILSLESVNGAIFLAVGNNTPALTVLQNQVSRKELDKVLSIMTQ
jgi:hypothetical protein